MQKFNLGIYSAVYLATIPLNEILSSIVRLSIGARRNTAAYVRAVGRLPFIAAARRVRQPGAKFDEMLVLESAQGKNKSRALELMAVKTNWFTDSLPLLQAAHTL